MLGEGIDRNVVQFWQIWMIALRYTNEKLTSIERTAIYESEILFDINALACFEF